MRTETAAGVDALRAYLDRTGFQQIYKYLAGVNHYQVTPSRIAAASAAESERFFTEVLSGCADLNVLQCLMFGRPADVARLSDAETRVADALVGAGLLRREGGLLLAGPHQLISAFGLDLLIDRRIHFGGGLHDVYIGPDSYWMLYYVDPSRIRREDRALDLCTGTGIAALYLSLFSDRVTATDIGAAPLELVEINRRLNGREAQVEIRNEDLRDTLGGGERFDVLTCNPPFVAFPPGLHGSLYAHGPDLDGLGYMRTIIERLPDVLNPGGTAYLVADMVGDKAGPHFVAELEAYAEAGRMAIDLYIDNIVDAEHQVKPLAAYLETLNAGRERTEIAAEIEIFQRHTLRAERYYMSTVRLRTAAASPGLRVLRRYVVPAKRTEEWPSLLLHTE